jgi:hypothetical protein
MEPGMPAEGVAQFQRDSDDQQKGRRKDEDKNREQRSEEYDERHDAILHLVAE